MNFLGTTNQQPFVDNQIYQFIFTILLVFLNLIILPHPTKNVCFCISNPKYNSKIALQTSYASIIKLHSWTLKQWDTKVTIQEALKRNLTLQWAYEKSKEREAVEVGLESTTTTHCGQSGNLQCRGGLPAGRGVKLSNTGGRRGSPARPV